MNKLLLALPLAAIAMPVSAANWVLAGRNVAGSVYEVDYESVSRSGTLVTFWLRASYGTGVAKPTEANGFLARRRADCSDRSYQDLQTNYMRDGRVTETTGEEPKRFAAPDSVASKVIARVCAR
jgi:hypothetical protein